MKCCLIFRIIATSPVIAEEKFRSTKNEIARDPRIAPGSGLSSLVGKCFSENRLPPATRFNPDSLSTSEVLSVCDCWILTLCPRRDLLTLQLDG